MKVRLKKEASVIVIWSVLGLMLAGMGVLVGELWQLQVMNTRGFEEVRRNQSVRRVRLPAVRGHQVIEINAEKGSVRFNLERLNELEVFWVGEEPVATQGFHQTLVTEAHHPFWEHWWPHGHIIGWEHTFVHEIAHLLDSIVNDHPVEPHGATFADGYRAAVVCDAILESAATRRQIDVEY